MEEFNDEPIEETQEKTLEELGLPNEIWNEILEFVYVDLSILDKAHDIYEAIDIIEKHISKYHATSSLVCKTYRDLNISKGQGNDFKKKIRKFYIPLLNERFLEICKDEEGKPGLYPKNADWVNTYEINCSIAKFLLTKVVEDKNLLYKLILYTPKKGSVILPKVAYDIKLIILLLFYSLDPNIHEQEQSTALSWAIINHGGYRNKNYINHITILLKHNANPDIQDTIGKTALHDVSSYGKTQILELLLNYSKNPNIQNYSGETALHNAIRGNYMNDVICLLNHGANPNIQDQNGYTPLHIAIYRHLPVIPLLEHNANPYIKNKQGKTAFDIAEEKNLNEFPQLIRKYAQNNLVKICIIQILNNLNLYENKLDTLPIELQEKINSLRAN